jgi:hypothetical protein
MLTNACKHIDARSETLGVTSRDDTQLSVRIGGYAIVASPPTTLPPSVVPLNCQGESGSDTVRFRIQPEVVKKISNVSDLKH